MRTKTITKSVGSMTSEEFTQCRNLNLRGRGYMRSDLSKAKKNHPSEAKVVMIKDYDNRLIAWSLAFPDNHGKLITQYYTRAVYRRRGYGDRLLKHTVKLGKSPIVIPGDRVSRAFFNKHKSEVTIGKYHEE